MMKNKFISIYKKNFKLSLCTKKIPDTNFSCFHVFIYSSVIIFTISVFIYSFIYFSISSSLSSLCFLCTFLYLLPLYLLQHQLAIPRNTLRAIPVLFISVKNGLAGLPVMLMPSVDRLEVAQALKTEVTEHVLRESKTKATNMSQAVRSSTVMTDICLVELGPSGHTISRVVDDSERVGSLRENVTLAAYEIETSDALDSKLVLLQVRRK